MAKLADDDSSMHCARTLLGVPLQTNVALMRADPTLFLARSTVLMKDRDSGKTHFFAGASVDANPRRAEEVSQYEVVERIFAMPSMHRGRKDFAEYDYFTDVPFGTTGAESVLITDRDGTLLPSGSEPVSRGAVGLGLGPSLSDAKRHAFWEALERHLRSQIWYGEKLICCVSDNLVLHGAFRLRRFTVWPESVPFCLSVITASRPARQVFYAGSAVHPKFAIAGRKADREALMMLDSYLSDRGGAANTERSRLRFLDLSGPRAAEICAYFESRIASSAEPAPPPEALSETAIAAAVLGAPPTAGEIRYCRLVLRGGFDLVRVYSPLLTWERQERVRHPSWPVSDPYC